ncbi:MAG: metallophosphoesterase [Lentisphaerae bacterium]|nr:metallophosphoesterase [Lentisphaerota bacterium]
MRVWMVMVVFAGLVAVHAGAVSLPAPPYPADPGNELSNGSFEEGEDLAPVAWFFANQHERTTGGWETNGAHGGAQCVRVVGGSGLGYGRWVSANRVVLTPGRAYRLSFWHRGAGGEVYVEGCPGQLDPATGRFTLELARAYKPAPLRTEPSADWRLYRKTFTAPDGPMWVRVCLASSGVRTAWFDDVALVGEGLHVVQPAAPVLVPVGGTAELVVQVEPPPAKEPAWELAPALLRLTGTAAGPTPGSWRLTVAGAEAGFGALELTARVAGAKPLVARRERFVRVYAADTRSFAFAAFTDIHLYRPGANERNVAFGRAADLIGALDPLFVLGLGDQMEISSGASDEQKRLIVAAVREQVGRMAAPVFMVSGNHEVDRTLEGAATRWYHTHALGQPLYHAFEVGPFLFAGFDDIVPGIYGREHSGGLVLPGEEAWLAAVLEAGKARGLFTVLYAHIPVLDGFPEAPDWHRLMRLIYANDVRLMLDGHVHWSAERWVRNPLRAGVPAPPWPKGEACADAAEVVARLRDPGNTVFAETTSGSAFMLKERAYNGIRYVWLRDGGVAWCDTVPISTSITVEAPAADVRVVQVRGGPERALRGLPVRVALPRGTYRATAGGKACDVVSEEVGGETVIWVQADVPAGGAVEIRVARE